MGLCWIIDYYSTIKKIIGGNLRMEEKLIYDYNDKHIRNLFKDIIEDETIIINNIYKKEE